MMKTRVKKANFSVSMNLMTEEKQVLENANPSLTQSSTFLMMLKTKPK
jgi:hypothetical protein